MSESELELDCGIEDGFECVTTTRSIFDVVPREGVFLGLDISKTSSGVTLIDNSKHQDLTITLEDVNSKHSEVLLRRQLKERLAPIVVGRHFDLIIVEDAFQGDNPNVTRLLYSLNTVIDEFIVDGECTCDVFMREDNQRWKKWLFTLDSTNSHKGYNDKVRIEYCLSLLGVKRDGSKGFQDKLDSLGLIVSYFLRSAEDLVENSISKVLGRRVRFSDISFSYQYFEEDVFFGLDSEVFEKGYQVETRVRVFTKKKMTKMLTENPQSIFMTHKRVVLGAFAEELKLDSNMPEGYFAFWIGKNLDRYLEM
jgi:hypothetical protein